MAGRRSVMGRSAVAGLVAVVLAIGTGLLGVAPAGAASPASGGPTALGSVPPQVQAAYDGEFLRRMVTATNGDLGQLRVGTVHQLFTFTQDFLDGGSAANPVEAGEAWIAGMELGGLGPTLLDVAGDQLREAYHRGVMQRRHVVPPPVRAASLGQDGALVGAAEACWAELLATSVSGSAG